MSEKSDVDILCPEIELYGHKLRPWALKQIAALSPHLYGLKNDIKSKGVDVFKVFGLDSGKKGGKGAANDQTVMLEGLFDLSTAIFPYAVRIICESSGMTQAEAEALSIDKALVFLLTIVEQNIFFLKNCFGLVTEKVASLQAAEARS